MDRLQLYLLQVQTTRPAVHNSIGQCQECDLATGSSFNSSTQQLFELKSGWMFEKQMLIVEDSISVWDF